MDTIRVPYASLQQGLLLLVAQLPTLLILLLPPRVALQPPNARAKHRQETVANGPLKMLVVGVISISIKFI